MAKTLCASLLLGLAVVSNGHRNSASKPNVLLIVADDQGYAQIGYHNKTTLTPKIDEIAGDGIILEAYYVQPVCSPTRSALMTGRYTYRLGTQATVIRADTPFGIPLENTFMARNMKDAGYTTAIFGKWHLGFYQRAYTPLARGFDYHLGYYQGTIDYYTHQGYNYGGTSPGLDWHRGNETSWFEDTGNYTAELIVPEVIKFFKQMAAKDEPFFLYLPFHLIHGPNEVPSQYTDLYPVLDPNATSESLGYCGVCECAGIGRTEDTAGWEPTMPIPEGSAVKGVGLWGPCRHVLGMASALDWAVGAVVDSLKDLKLYDNTIIIYTSDNGAQQGQGGTSFPLRGWKTQLYEGGVRVPGWVSGGSPLIPDNIRGTINHKMYHITDWLPTIVALGGGSTDNNLALDGYNVWPSLVGDVDSPRTEILLNMNPACGEGYVTPPTGIRMGDYKLLVDCFNTSTLKPNDPTKVELFNIAKDEFEQNEISQSNPTVVKQLLERLATYGSSTDQVPPTLFWPFNQTYHGVKPWNYQCTKCRQGGALPGPQGNHFDPWCDDINCNE